MIKQAEDARRNLSFDPRILYLSLFIIIFMVVLIQPSIMQAKSVIAIVVIVGIAIFNIIYIYRRYKSAR